MTTPAPNKYLSDGSETVNSIYHFRWVFMHDLFNPDHRMMMLFCQRQGEVSYAWRQSVSVWAMLATDLPAMNDYLSIKATEYEGHIFNARRKGELPA